MSLMVGLAPISVCGQMSGPVRYDALLNQISLSSQEDKHIISVVFFALIGAQEMQMSVRDLELTIFKPKILRLVTVSC